MKNSVRIVCTVWADLSASHLGRLCCLRVSHNHLKDMTSFNPKLIRNISLHLKTDSKLTGSSAGVLNYRYTDAVTVVPEIPKLLTHLIIHFDTRSLPKLGEMWGTFIFRDRLGMLVEKWGVTRSWGRQNFDPSQILRGSPSQVTITPFKPSSRGVQAPFCKGC